MNTTRTIAIATLVCVGATGLTACGGEDSGAEEPLRKGMKKGDTTTVNGQEAIALKKKDGSETLSLYVATDGKPCILKATSTGGENPSTMNFTDYNETVKATPPPAGEVVDPKKLAGNKV